MTTTTLADIVDKFDVGAKIHPDLGTALYRVAMHQIDDEVTSRMASMVTPGGMATKPRAQKEKKAPKMTEADLMKGADKFMRPNGEAYFTRKWGEHDDVLALRTARDKSFYSLFYGSPGCGKTALVEAAFCDQPGGLYTVLGSGDTEVADLVGGYVQTPSGGFV
jgi:nitric oxide reductase NorQ protein